MSRPEYFFDGLIFAAFALFLVGSILIGHLWWPRNTPGGKS